MSSSIKEWYTPEEEKALVWLQHKKSCKILQQYNQRDNLYALTSQAYSSYNFVKDDYYDIDIRFVYGTYWSNMSCSCHTASIFNVRKSGESCVAPEEYNIKLIHDAMQTWNNSKVDTSLKKFIDSKLNID